MSICQYLEYIRVYTSSGSQIRPGELIILGLGGHAMVDPPEGCAAEYQKPQPLRKLGLHLTNEIFKLRPISENALLHLPLGWFSIRAFLWTGPNCQAIAEQVGHPLTTEKPYQQKSGPKAWVYL